MKNHELIQFIYKNTNEKIAKIRYSYVDNCDLIVTFKKPKDREIDHIDIDIVYIPKQKKIGLFIAKQVDNKIEIGWSLCCKDDIFDEKQAFDNCYKRIYKSTDIDNFDIPYSIKNEYNKFADRCERYFKNVEVVNQLKPKKKKSKKSTCIRLKK